MSFNLRPRQKECVDKVRSLIREGKKSILIVGPPGVGKGSLISYFTSNAVLKGNGVLQFVHKRDLVFNLADRLKKQFKIESGIILPGFKPEKKRLSQIGSVQTLTRRELEWLKNFVKLVIGDESHRMLTPTQLKLYDEFVCALNGLGLPALWFTATPFRPKSDKKKFSDYCDAIVQFTTYRQEMEDRFLVPTDVVSPVGAASMDGVKLRIKFGEKDFDEEEMSRRFSEERVVKALFKRWKEYTGGKMQTCIFNVDKSHNKTVYEYFKSQGVSCASIDEDTPIPERDRILRKYQEGPFCENPIMVLMNIAILAEGIDNQWIKCVIQNYSSLSFTKYVQTTARGSRTCWNDDYSDWLKIDGKYYKEKLLVLDLGGNTLRHGKLEDYDVVPFDLSGQKPPGEAPTKECKECHRIIYASYRECPHCGYVFPVQEKKDKKKYLDEVEMERLDGDKALQKMILGMSQEQIWTCHAGYLRVIALTKGYQPSWCYHVLRDRGEYLDGDEKAPNDWAAFYKYLAANEKMKGMTTVYERMKNRQISK